MKLVLRYPQKSRIPEGYVADSHYICSILRSEGFDVTPEQCYKMWDDYSDSLCAGWIILPKDDYAILRALTYYEDDVGDTF